ncbi:MAG: HAMP domain-containing histidine kinase [Acidobacteria bacterium]|nr:HAMP domain-containing histidine kinase [Acidobacteriota bacterium]
MVWSGHSKSSAWFIALGAVVVAAAIALNVGWILLNWRTGLLLILGVLFFGLIITGAVLNTIFLVREVRRNEQHNAFINAVTHELKTPVASIRLYLETMQARELEESRQREFRQVMIEDCDRLLHTIDQVLRAGQSGSSNRRIRGSAVDLAETVRECLDLARTRHRLSPESLKYRQAVEGSAIVMGDVHELRTAITNLVDNAVKYSAGTVDVLVELVHGEDRTLQVRVADHGIGIEPVELRRIFRRFYRIPGAVAGRVKGMGLGLYIVNSVAKRHGGRVFAESGGHGQGSTFTLQLPAAPEAS